MKYTAPVVNTSIDDQPHHNSTPPHGFTLVEALLSISVLAILAAIALPQLNGIYERQKLTNSANQLVTDIKTLQNKALANNQDRYAVSSAQGGPLTDCIPNPSGKPYVDAYRFTTSLDGRGYNLEFGLKPLNNAGVACPQPSDKISTVLLPDGVRFSGDFASKTISYTTVSGKITPSTPQELILVSDRIDQSAITYYICINPGRVYVQSSTCP